MFDSGFRVLGLGSGFRVLGFGFIEIVKGLGAKNVLTEGFDRVFLLEPYFESGGWAVGWAVGWAGLGWAGLGWAGLGWAGLGWAGRAGPGLAGWAVGILGPGAGAGATLKRKLIYLKMGRMFSSRKKNELPDANSNKQFLFISFLWV